jgi:uncharacterized iron-regulated membrane protein
MTKSQLRRIHRWLALALGVLWLSQAVTGLLMVYRWELDDAPLGNEVVPFDVAALGARIAAIEADPAGRTVTSLWATGGVDGRYDLYVDDAEGNTDIVRVDGAGKLLRTRASGDGFIPTAADLHQTLLAGDLGKTIIGVSGLVLLSAIVLGLVLAWPARAGQWRAVLWPKGARPGAARRYAWHRAAGLWLAVPAVVFLSAGVLMTFESTLEHWLGLDSEPSGLEHVATPGPTAVPAGRALAIALAQFPGSTLSGASLPSNDAPWYRIRVRQPDEWRRVYGTSVVYVAAADGRVLRTEDALHAPTASAFMSNLYPVHTGEALGGAGRLLALATAAWLLTMLVLGFGLWSARRVKKK